MIQHALHQSAYLDVAQYYQKVWETPSVKNDGDNKGKAVRPSCRVVFLNAKFGTGLGACCLLSASLTSHQ